MGHLDAEGKPQFVSCFCFILFFRPEGPESYLPHVMKASSEKGRGPLVPSWGLSIAVTLEVSASIGSAAKTGLWCRVLRGRLTSEQAFD